MKISEIIKREDPRPVNNFTADDLNHLKTINDLSRAKEFALSLVTRPSQKPLSPKKRAWFSASINRAKSVDALVKMLWSMLLSGEKQSVIGSRYSTEPSYYRSQIGEDDSFMMRAYEMDPMYAMTPDGGTHRLNGKRHDAAVLPVGSVVLDTQEHDPGQVSYTLWLKTGEGTDLMDKSFEDKGFLKVSPYAKPDQVMAAFAQEAPKLLA